LFLGETSYLNSVGIFKHSVILLTPMLIVINALDVYMVRCEVVFMRETSIQGALEGVGMKIKTGCRPNDPSVASVILAATGRDFHTHPF